MPNAVHSFRVDVAARKATAPHGATAVGAEQAREAVLHAGALGALVRPRSVLIPPARRGHSLAIEASPRRRRLRAQDKPGVLVQLRRRADVLR